MQEVGGSIPPGSTKLKSTSLESGSRLSSSIGGRFHGWWRAVSAKLHSSPSGARLRVGVSGHRGPPKLPEQSLIPLRKALDFIFASAAANAAEHIVVSSLAEGADRLVAETGLAAGFILQAVLPLPRNEYARDFATAKSRAAFENLLARASEVIELPGDAGARPRAYEAAGLLMLARIDMLIAIWDGEPAAGTGGTAEIVDRALADGILVVWIEPARPETMQLSQEGGFHPGDPAALARAVRALAAIPSR